MRIVFAIFLLLGLAACNRSAPNNDAVRQGVLDHLAQAGLNMAGMDVTFQSIDVKGDQATAAVTISAKGATTGQGMQTKYHLQMKDGKWVYTGREDGGSQHGAGAVAPGVAAPGAANPHAGGSMGAPAAGGKMPSPEDLPPATKKQ